MDAYKVFDPRTLEVFGVEICQRVLDGIEQGNAAEVKSLSALVLIGQAFSRDRQEIGGEAANAAVVASELFTLPEIHLLERAYLMHPDWIDPGCIDRSDPMIPELVEIGDHASWRFNQLDHQKGGAA